MMERLDVPFYKVASRDLTNLPLLERIARTGKPVIISTGMADMEDIRDALDVLGKDRDDIIILQCISQYPADLERVNLRAMDTMRKAFGKIVGYSDHTTGIVAPVTAAILGAAVIEKHITLNKAMKGSDHAASAEREELTKMVQFIRDARKTLGDGVKAVDPATAAAKAKLARSLTSKVDIAPGTVLTEDMLTLKSPGTGLKWKEKDKILGKKAKVFIEADTTLSEDMFE
jgi:sialic acid synthase SpsE